MWNNQKLPLTSISTGSFRHHWMTYPALEPGSAKASSWHRTATCVKPLSQRDECERSLCRIFWRCTYSWYRTICPVCAASVYLGKLCHRARFPLPMIGTCYIASTRRYDTSWHSKIRSYICRQSYDSALPAFYMLTSRARANLGRRGPGSLV